jgi:hypothetical protein
MTRFKLFASAAILSALSATQAMAQHMVEEPGMFAFYHPNGDLGIASTRSPVDAQATAPMRNGNKMPALVMRSMRPAVARRAKSDKPY